MSKYRSVAEDFPALAKQWHPTLNDASPTATKPGSDSRVWWLCPADDRHVWDAPVKSRALGGVGCPICANKLVVPGLNDLATTHPDVAAQWHPTLNVKSPSEVNAGSNAEYHWLCPVNPRHVWEARVKNRAKMGVGCPFCSNRRTLPDENNLATHRLDLAAEWHPTLNERRAEEVSENSGFMAWWLCSKNPAHEWSATVGNRAAKSGTGCPFCANKRIIAGENSLVHVSPEIAAEWHPDNRVRPDEVAPASNTPVMWLCLVGHVWTTSPSQRTVKGRGCPVCANQMVLVGFNDLATTNPSLVAEWADSDVLPTDVTRGSNFKALWRCSARGHEWRTSVSSRTGARPNGCPECNASTFSSKFEKEIKAFVGSILPGVPVQSTRRGLISNGRFDELDIFIPSLGVAIEANGVYWHSEAAGKDRDYHLRKREACERAGIQLIQVWEDDWANRRETVERMLAHKLGASGSRTVFARNTVPEFVTAAEAADLLDKYHVQGAVSGSFYLGLREKESGELVAVMVLKRQGQHAARTLRLERYATSVRLPGGHSKLVKFAETAVPDWDELVTFADLEVSDGSLYEATGWVKDATLRPDYRYVVGNRRRHKFGYRLARFRSDPGLIFEEGLTERQLAELNRLYRVWDSGKIRYRYSRVSG